MIIIVIEPSKQLCRTATLKNTSGWIPLTSTFLLFLKGFYFKTVLQNSYFKKYSWLDSFDFYVLTVPERFLLSYYIDILVDMLILYWFPFHYLSIGFIASAMDYPLAHRLTIIRGTEVGEQNHWLGVGGGRNKLKCQGFFSKNRVGLLFFFSKKSYRTNRQNLPI